MVLLVQDQDVVEARDASQSALIRMVATERVVDDMADQRCDPAGGDHRPGPGSKRRCIAVAHDDLADVAPVLSCEACQGVRQKIGAQ
ncbi:hypothetical protein [Variovorax rhizosphaerae]|uniref:Uncharacterized protein n=1 Tax=Variovorax rhizosphaerae TaxID=1836200 RepID=A0ABU8WY35_9BURK